MLLINGVRTGGGPGRYLGGSTVISIDRMASWLKPGGQKNAIVAGEARVDSVSDRNGLPSGASHPTAWLMPRKAGGIASRFNISGLGAVYSANLAGGVTETSSMEGSSSLVGDIYGIGVAVSTLAASGGITAGDLIGLITAAAAVDGVGGLVGSLAGLITAVADLSGDSYAQGDLAGALEASAALLGDSQFLADVTGVIQAAATITGSGGIVPADIIGAMAATATLIGSGNLVGASRALAHISAALEGVATVTASSRAVADMSSSITSQAEVLTAAAIAQQVMDYNVEGGLSFQDVTRIVAAVLAGKTGIVDNGDGTATVTFRSISDANDLAVFSVEGSERTNRIDDL